MATESNEKREEIIPEHRRKRRRVSAILGAAVVCAVILVAGIGVHVANLEKLSGEAMAQQTASAMSLPDPNEKDDENKKTSTKWVSVPPLVDFLGSTQEEVVAALGEGATIRSLRTVNQSGSAVAQVATIALTNLSANISAGTPTVTLALDAEGKVIQAGFTANIRLLGYAAISFVDAVENMHVIETLLGEAGLTVPVGIKVPESKAEYAYYGADGITLESEKYTFSGKGTRGDDAYDWSSEVAYDYAQANATGNLVYTVRLVTVTVIAQR